MRFIISLITALVLAVPAIAAGPCEAPIDPNRCQLQIEQERLGELQAQIAALQVVMVKRESDWAAYSASLWQAPQK